MDAVVIAEDDDHFGARERPERLVQQRNDVRRTGPAAAGALWTMPTTSAATRSGRS